MDQQQEQQSHQQYTIIIDGKTNLRSKNACNALKRSVRAFLETCPTTTSTATSISTTSTSTQEALQTHQPFQEFAKPNFQLDFSIQENETITIKATQTKASIEKDKLKDKLNQLKQQRTQTVYGASSSSTNQAYKKLITMLNQQPNGAMLSKLIPDPKKLAESSPQELQMQTSLFESLPMNNQLKKLIVNYFNSI